MVKIEKKKRNYEMLERKKYICINNNNFSDIV